MEFERKLLKWGKKSMVFVIPPDLIKNFDLKESDVIIIKDDEGKHGEFISFWKKEKTSEQTKRRNHFEYLIEGYHKELIEMNTHLQTIRSDIDQMETRDKKRFEKR